jgi:uncharacterized protein
MNAAPESPAMRLAAIAALIVLTAVPLAAQETPRRIVVTGEGRVEAAPDLARFTAGVEAEALEAAAALAAASATMRDVFAALEAAGIASEDMRTSRLAVDPVWEHGDGRQPRVRGFSASNLVTVRVRDVDALGALIDAVGAAGANRIEGIGFDVSEPRAALDAARRAAVADARAKAEVIAGAAGVTLGPVLSIREGGAGGPEPMMARAEFADAAPPVAAGVVDLSARVEIVYALE